MCFSANASFAASGLLTFIGCASLYRTHKDTWQFLACTPLFFALQQGAEGIIWRTINTASHNSLLDSATHIYIFFAYIFWPMWIPFALVLLEQNALRKKMLLGLLMFGSAFSVFALWSVVTYGIQAVLVDNHLLYLPMHTTPTILSTLFSYLKALYVIIVVVPFFISSIPHMMYMGIAISGAYIVTELWYYHHLTSVWCFFAALLSSLLYIILVYNQKIRQDNQA